MRAESKAATRAPLPARTAEAEAEALAAGLGLLERRRPPLDGALAVVAAPRSVGLAAVLIHAERHGRQLALAASGGGEDALDAFVTVAATRFDLEALAAERLAPLFALGPADEGGALRDRLRRATACERAALLDAAPLARAIGGAEAGLPTEVLAAAILREPRCAALRGAALSNALREAARSPAARWWEVLRALAGLLPRERAPLVVLAPAVLSTSATASPAASAASAASGGDVSTSASRRSASAPGPAASAAGRSASAVGPESEGAALALCMAFTLVEEGLPGLHVVVAPASALDLALGAVPARVAASARASWVEASAEDAGRARPGPPPADRAGPRAAGRPPAPPFDREVRARAEGEPAIAPPATPSGPTPAGPTRDVATPSAPAPTSSAPTPSAPAPCGSEGNARSLAERGLHEALERGPETRGWFTLNARVPVAFRSRPFTEVDLYAGALGLAIEVDGYHHFRDPEDFRRDREKDWVLQRHGLVVLRFLAEDVDERLDAVLARVVEAVAHLRPTDAGAGDAASARRPRALRAGGSPP